MISEEGTLQLVDEPNVLNNVPSSAVTSMKEEVEDAM